MTKTSASIDRQRIAFDYLEGLGLQDHDLIEEAALFRGFLVLPKSGRRGIICLAKGSHPKDIEALNLCGLVLQSTNRWSTLLSWRNKPNELARRIIYLGEHRGMSTVGPSQWKRTVTWGDYGKMVWGAKLPVTGNLDLGVARHYKDPCRLKHIDDALDLGVSLLVKTLPLIRVCTRMCCDGHGTTPFRVYFQYEWDHAWFTCVYQKLLAMRVFSPIGSSWNVSEDCLSIEPSSKSFSAESWLRVFLEIQEFSRLLMSQPLINAVGKARQCTLQDFGSYRPLSSDCFRKVAEKYVNQTFY